MRIEHIAIWTENIEKLKKFYIKYFNAKSNEKYENKNHKFESYFLSFETGARLELMNIDSLENLNKELKKHYIGLVHIAFSVGSKEKVDELTKKIEEDGYIIDSYPRVTGDGYYESCIFDPDGNKIEITI